jgi:hypothetical protein
MIFTRSVAAHVYMALCQEILMHTGVWLWKAGTFSQEDTTTHGFWYCRTVWQKLLLNGYLPGPCCLCFVDGSRIDQ